MSGLSKGIRLKWKCLLTTYPEEEFQRDCKMIEFCNEEEKNMFYEQMGIWLNMENDQDTVRCNCVEVIERGDIKLFHFPKDLCWFRFRGEFGELYNLLKTSCPKRFEKLKFCEVLDFPLIFM